MNHSVKGFAVLVTGSREFTDREMVELELANLPTPVFVIHGGARGADRLASEGIHKYPGLVEVRMPYLQYEEKRGGWIRNQKMLEVLNLFRDAGYECWALAFHDDISQPTKGTAGMVKLLDDEDYSIVHIDEKRSSLEYLAPKPTKRR